MSEPKEGIPIATGCLALVESVLATAPRRGPATISVTGDNVRALRSLSKPSRRRPALVDGPTDAIVVGGQAVIPERVLTLLRSRGIRDGGST